MIRTTPELLHSLMEFKPILDGLLRSDGVRSVVEIGSEHGGFSRHLMELASAGILDRVTIIEPFPIQGLVDAAENSNGKSAVIARLSLDALPSVPAHDVYFVDGDHNYYTVRRELAQIFEKNHDAIVVLHDVCWPSARRDSYYSPSSIPLEQQHASSYEAAIVPDFSGIVKTGFCSEGQFALALKEGGPQNGVLTAIEDFISQRGEMSFDIIPAVFGLGVLRRTGHPLEKNISAILPAPGYAALLARLEANRMENWINLLPKSEVRAKSGWKRLKSRIKKLLG